jgi:hypothetical protein
LEAKALKLQNQNGHAFTASLIADDIEQCRQEWAKEKEKREVNHVSK